MAPISRDKARAVVHKHIARVMELIQKPAKGWVKHDYLANTHGEYYQGICTWDHYHAAMRFAVDGKYEYLRNQVDNSLEFQADSGYVPCNISIENGPREYTPLHHAQPFLMQAANNYVKFSEDTKWGKTRVEKLGKYLEYYDTHYNSPMNLYRWPDVRYGGIDNDVTSFFRPCTFASPDLCAWMYLEHQSAAELYGNLGETDKANFHHHKADEIKSAVNEILWSENDESYCAYDFSIGGSIFSINEAGLSPSVGRYAYQTCSNLIPLYAKLASPKQAEAMIERYVLSEDHFFSKYGIRSLSKSSEFYNNAVWGNPPRFSHYSIDTNSNWQGPVWIPICYFMYKALVHYGYETQARQLEKNTLSTLANSVILMGSFSENYHAETGEPLYAKDFASWNILADVFDNNL